MSKYYPWTNYLRSSPRAEITLSLDELHVSDTATSRAGYGAIRCGRQSMVVSP
jgi:hypothetical protein